MSEPMVRVIDVHCAECGAAPLFGPAPGTPLRFDRYAVWATVELVRRGDRCPALCGGQLLWATEPEP